MLMDILALAEKIKHEIDSGDFSLQAVFNRNIQTIEEFKKEGYSYRKIFNKLDTGINEKHLRDLIRRAKNLAGKALPINPKGSTSISKKEVDPSQTKNSNHANKNEPTVTTQPQDISDSVPLKLSVEEWNKQTMIKMSEHIVRQLEEKGFDPEAVNKLGIHSVYKLNTYLANYEVKSKYKPNRKKPCS